MKLTGQNNYLFLIKTSIVVNCLLISYGSQAQNTYGDTSGVEVTEATKDSTIEELPAYFDLKSPDGSSDSIELRHVPVWVMDSLKKDDAFWYANGRVRKQEETDPNSATRTPHWLKALTWTIIVGVFIAALIWYLTTSNILVFAKRQKKIDREYEETGISEDIFSIDYQVQINKAIREEDYRVAVRLMFLRLLKTLSNRNLIQYRPGKTNFEYLAQLSPTNYYNDFFRITRNYEYAWYGKFDVSREAFKTIEHDFENLDHRLT